MTEYEWRDKRTTYLNPVYKRPCPDPFVLKYLNEYWCYCTGFWRDGRCFGVLHSRDLVEWHEVGSAMDPVDSEATCYWAPEVWYEDGRFLMYYSVGNEDNMQIHVAVADHPAGPFIDSGRRLTAEGFAIDAHVFEDDDGSRYLFYATDFLQHTRIGTGTVCDRMLDPFTLAGNPRPVTRASYEWQTYDPHRLEKGGVHWHTIEGPFVLKRKGRYYQMFSAGNWKNETYGASYAVSDEVVTAGEWRQVADGERVFPILRTIPGQVIGPGHNSVVRGPDNRQLFCVYHRWDMDVQDRALAIDRLDWAGERMLVIGPSTAPQPRPQMPAFSDFFDRNMNNGLGPGWECVGGRWRSQDGAAVQEVAEGITEARCLTSSPYFLAEVSLRTLDNPGGNGGVGVKLLGEQEDALYFELLPGSNHAVVAPRPSDAAGPAEQLTLPRQFLPNAYHHLRVEANGPLVTIALDGSAMKWEGRPAIQPNAIALFTRNAAAAFAGFALTVGWEDLFTGPTVDPADSGWLSEANSWRVSDQHLWHVNPEGQHAIITKGPPLSEYEMVVNAKFGSLPLEDGCYGFLPAMSAAGSGPLLTVERDEAGWLMRCCEGAEAHAFRLPDEFDPFNHYQFRFRKQQ
ncbi:MAG TPA: glycoside hydrolase family 43 protein, partial [Blastocatellia bacterium]|nr:glycoside hydrolase family 43 protein [Blastocatellia bacterium]